MLRQIRRYPLAVRHAVGGETGAGFDKQAVHVAVIAAPEFDDPRLSGRARASLIALMVASVPELVKRTISMDGKASTISRASAGS